MVQRISKQEKCTLEHEMIFKNKLKYTYLRCMASSVIDQIDVKGARQEAEDNNSLSSLLHCKSIIYESWAENDSSS